MSSDADDDLAPILVDLLERRRAGARIDLSDSLPAHPELREGMACALSAMEALESMHSRPETSSPPRGAAVDAALAEQDALIRRVARLRECEGRSWQAISEVVGRPPEVLHREYARALLDVIQHIRALRGEDHSGGEEPRG